MPFAEEQYLKALDIFDSENSRFWTRFNIFTGLQLIVVAGFASNYDALTKHRFVACLLLVIAFIFSVFTILVVWRSRQISLGIFEVLKKIEKQHESFLLVTTYMEATKSPMGVIARYCVAMSVVLAAFWILFSISLCLAG